MKRTALKRTFAVFCAIGFATQCSLIASDYFAYHTSTKVTIETKAMNRAPTVTFCARYIDLMDSERLFREKKIRIKTEKSVNETIHDIHYKQSGKLTVKDLFEYTPPVSDAMKNCRTRDAHNYRTIGTQTLAQCFERFNISKFYMQSFMCYNFRPVPSFGSFSITEIANSYNFEMAVYALYLPRTFASPRVVFMTLSPEDFPYVSRSYGAYLRTKLNSDMRDFANDFLVQNKISEVHLQPPPYDTMCVEEVDFEAKTQCLIRKMRERGMHRVPNTEIIRFAYDLHHVLWNDETNKTTKGMIDACYADCESVGKREKCRYSFAETEVSMAGGPDFADQLRLRVMGPSGPNVLVLSHPQFKASEFFLYIFSSAGIWFGISILHFNPLLFVRWMWRRHETYNKNKREAWTLIRPHHQVFGMKNL